MQFVLTCFRGNYGHLFSLEERPSLAPPGTRIDKIACNYPNMQWWISEHGLTMDIVVPTPPP